MYNMGHRMRCENCKYGHCDYDARQKPIKAYCNKLDNVINEKVFNELMACLYFEERG